MAKIDEKCENCGYFERNGYWRWCSLCDTFLEDDEDACNNFNHK